MSELKLQVLLNLKDKMLGPLKNVSKGGSELAQQMRQSKEALNKLQSSQNDISSFQKLKAQTQSTSQELATKQQRVKELAAQLKQTDAPTKKLTSEFAKAKRESQALKGKLGEQNLELQKSRDRLTQAGISTRNLTEHEKRLRSEKEQLNATLQRQQQQFNRLAMAKRKDAELSERHNKAMAKTAVVAGVGYAGMSIGRNMLNRTGGVLAPGVDFGAQMSELQAIARLDKDDDRFKALKAQARELGGTTQFTGAEAGAGQTFLARAGFGADAILQSMPDVLAMAIANNTELGRTADIASNISSAFKIDPSKAGAMTRVADVLSGTSARANVNLEMLGDTMKYLGGAEDLNLTLEQAAAMAGLLGNIGIQGGMAGTTMRAMMNRLTNPVGRGATAIEELGIKVADAKGQMRALPDILQEIAKATEKMGNIQRKAYLQNIFGEEAGSGMTELVAQMADGNLSKLILELQNVEGENMRMAKTMADNTKVDLMGFKSAWQDIGISLTETNDSPLRALIQDGTKALRFVSRWIQENPKLASGMAKAVALFAIMATVGGALAVALASILVPALLIKFGFAKLAIGGLANIGIFKKLGATARIAGGGIGLLVAGVGKGAIALPGLAKNTISKTLSIARGGIGLAKTMVLGTMGIIKTGAMAIVFGIRHPFQAFQFALAGAGRGLAQFWLLAKSGGRAGLLALRSGIVLVTKSLIAMGIAAMTNPLILGVMLIAGAALLIYKYWGPVKAFFSGLWDGLKQGLAPLATIYSVFFSTIGGLLSPLKPLWDGLANAMSVVVSWGKQLFAPFQATSEQLAGATSAGKAFGFMLGNILTFALTLPGAFVALGAAIINGLISGVLSVKDKLFDLIGGIGKSLAEKFKGVLGIKSPSRVMMTVGHDTMDGLQIGLQARQQPLLDNVGSVAQGIIDKAKAIPLLAAATFGASQAVALGLPTPQSPIPIDARPAVAQAPVGARQVTIQGDTIHFTITAPQGSDTRELKQMIERVLQERDQQKRARLRSALTDQE